MPSLNTFAAAFFPGRADRAVLYLNALLGLGTALAPVLVAVFVGSGFWWGLPLVVAVAARGALAFSLGLPLAVAASTAARQGGGRGDPARFWIFAAFAVLYGVVETMNGNWATLYMTQRSRRIGDRGVPRADGVLGRWSPSAGSSSRPSSAGCRSDARTGCCHSWPPSASR